ncbi:hypothetical protein [Agromyces sp. CCNWLW203]|uniref:hypothetical protein n=1 Tax=Agromyces sp. CCNWLW203 TaxID=3112842 RepID=UPI002F966ED2
MGDSDGGAGDNHVARIHRQTKGDMSMAFAIRGKRLAAVPTGALTSAFILSIVIVCITAVMLGASIVAGIGVATSGASKLWVDIATMVVTLAYVALEISFLIVLFGAVLVVNSISVFDTERFEKRQVRALLRSHTGRWALLWSVAVVAVISTASVEFSGGYVVWLLIQGALVAAGVMACVGLRRIRSSSKQPLLAGLTPEQQDLVVVKPRASPMWNEPLVIQILEADEARNYAHVARQKAKSLQMFGLGIFIVASAFIANSVQLMWELPSERWTGLLPAAVILAALAGWALQESAKRYSVLAERYELRAVELETPIPPSRWWVRLRAARK